MAFHFTPAYELIDDLSNQRLSATDLMKSTIGRIWDVSEDVNAIVSLREEQDLLEDAATADQVPLEQRGALHGIPIAIKDLANAKGLLTTEGSPFFANRIAEKDDLMVARIRKAGAIIIGKTNTPEFGL